MDHLTSSENYTLMLLHGVCFYYTPIIQQVKAVRASVVHKRIFPKQQGLLWTCPLSI